MRPIRPTSSYIWRVPVIITLVALGIGLWVARPWLVNVTAWTSKTLVPIGNWVENRFGPSNNIQALEQERDDLHTQLLQVSQQLATTKLQLEISQTIENLNTFLDEQSLRTVSAVIIAYSPDPGIESIVIQRGTDQAVTKGQAVITDRGVIIGTVIQTNTKTSVVRLLTDSQSRLLGKVQNESQSRGLVAGERGLSLSMQFLPHQDKIESGQTVVTSGLDPKIPPDLLIATVQKVDRRPGELFQTAQLQSPIDFGRLRVVAVVLGRQ